MTDNLPVKYTRTDIENARTKGQLIGWVQAGAVVLGGVLLLKAIGWLPVLLMIVGAGFIGYKVLTRKKKSGSE
ncbi:MAG: hypothetical protein HKM89_06350 [Gemmatimonadales bacterium]|nr:hypothetical protein [Gemmatimonadales bacterium]